ncbi:MAG TPA: hypothetical protein VGS21_08825 [Acidimicrobiales bacterium]|nr:hypothetical protein [Acidimicrobiales bacterium]
MKIRNRLAAPVGVLAVGALAALAVAPAGASSSGNHASGSHVVAGVREYGLKPIHGGIYGGSYSTQAGTPLKLSTSDKSGAVTPHPKVYLVFWGSQWSSDPAGAETALANMFTDLHGSPDTWGTVLDQYCEGLAAGTTNCGTAGNHVKHPTASILAGVWDDNTSAEPTNATAAQIGQEAVKAATHFGNTTQSSNIDAQYVIASPTGTHPDGFPNSGFCGWHNFVSSTDGKLAYTNLPYVPDLGVGACTTLSPARMIDGYESTETHEYAETVTDTWPSRGWLDTSGNEIGDKCVNLDAYLTIGTDKIDVQGIWSNKAAKCVTKG